MASARLTDCVQPLAERWLDTKAEYEAKYPGNTLLITCTYRSPEEQFELYKKGRRQQEDGTWVPDASAGHRVTGIDGKTKRSNHNANPAAALDFAVVTHGKISWEFKEYEHVGEIGELYGLVWGGRWKTLKDGPHFELPS